MSDVMYYTAIPEGRTDEYEMVMSPDFERACDDRDAAQSELAREEKEHAELRDVVAALREELANLTTRYQSDCTELSDSLAAAEQRNAELLTLLRSASIDYACCLESGYDRITSLGGDCDSVEKMLADNPNYAKYNAALAKPTESGASE